LRFWRNTAIAALAPGTTYTTANGIPGYEWDEELHNGFRPAGLIDLSSTTINITPDLLLDYGATFGVGTVPWSCGMDPMWCVPALIISPYTVPLSVRFGAISCAKNALNRPCVSLTDP